MATLLLTLLVILVSIAGLGIGVLCGRRALAGSCGGLSCGGCSKTGTRKCREVGEDAP